MFEFDRKARWLKNKSQTVNTLSEAEQFTYIISSENHTIINALWENELGQVQGRLITFILLILLYG